MQRSTMTKLASLALGLTATTLGGSARAADAPPLKIGVVFSYTNLGDSGKEVDGAIAAYMRQHGDTIAGRKIQIIRRDDTGPKPDLVKRLAQELVVDEHVDILFGCAYTPNAIALNAISTAAKKPAFIVNAAASGILAKAPYATRYGLTEAQVVVPLAKWSLKNRIKTVYQLYADYGPGIDGAMAFARAFAAGGGKVNGEVRVPLGSAEFSSYVQRIKDAKPDAVFVFLPEGEQPNQFLKAFHDGGLANAGIKIISDGSLVTEDELDVEGDNALGVVSAYHYSMVHDSPANHVFTKAFADSVGPTPRPNLFAVAAYDAMAAIYKVVGQQGGNVDPERTIALLRGLKLESPRGPVLIDPATRDIVQNVYIRRVERRNGKLVDTEIDTTPMVKDPNE